MTDITTKPFVSQAQQRFAFATRQPWARRWARETNFAQLPERKADDERYTPPTGARGNARKVLEWRRKYGARVRGMTRIGWGRARQLASGRPISLAIVKRMASFNRHRQNATVAPEYRDEPWRDAGYVAWLGWGGDTGIDWALEISQRARTKGEQIAPGITRIRGNLCNVHGKYGPCDAALSGKPKKGGGKSGAGKKPAKKPAKMPAKTPEQRAQEREQKQAEQRAETLEKLNIAPDGQEALEALRAGKQPDIEALKRGGFEKAGLIEQSTTDDTWRLTASGRAMLNAADAGDVGRAGATIGTARDREAARAGRQAQAQERKRQTEEKRRQAEQKRQDAAQKRQQRPPSRGTAAPPSENPVNEPTPRRDQIARSDQVDQEQAQERNRRMLVNRLRQSSQAAQRQAEQQRRAQAQAQRTQDQKRREQQRAQEQQVRREEQQARREEQQRAQERQRTITLRRLASGGRLTDTQVADLEDAGLVEVRANGEPKMTEAGRARIATRKAASPDDYLVVEDRAKPSTWHLQIRRSGKPDHNLMGAAWAALHSGYRGNVYQGPQKDVAIATLKRLYTAERMSIPTEKSASPFQVFKDASGKYRWILRTTTAFEDRDREILSTKALESDAARMTATQQFGPLRYWHVGTPDPFNADAPWGVGLDIGMCDYSVVIGRTSVESGTFFDDRIGAAIAAKADQYEASPGFFHPSDQPDASGTFWTIRRFERSLVPRQFGRASNRFTGLAVGRTSKSMDQAEYNRRVQAFLADMQSLGVPAEASAEVVGAVRHQEKAADDQHVAFKDAANDCPEDIVINGVVYTAKCVDQKAAMPAEEAAPTEEIGDEAMEMNEEEMVGGLTLSEDDLAAIAERVGQIIASGLAEALAPLVGALNIESKMAGMMEEIKGAMGGYIKKKDAEGAEQRQQIADLAQRTADLAQQTGSLAATVKQATVKVDELLGEQPDVTPGRASASPATQINPTSATDQTLLAAAKTQLPPDNPFADILSQLFNQPISP